MGEKLITAMALLILFFGYCLAAAANWTIRKFGEVTYEQVVFHLNMPLDSEVGLIISFLQNTLMMGTICTALLYFVLRAKVIYRRRLLISVIWMTGCLFFVLWRLNLPAMMEERKLAYEISGIYEKHYIAPTKEMIEFPESKKNLVIIFIESMETAYADGGYFDDNLMPNLSKLSDEYINFSHDDDMGGAAQIMGAHYTQASMIAQTCGIPLRLPIDARRFLPKKGFLPGAVCLFDILAEEGYNQSFMTGITKEFSGMDRFIGTHGNAKILDWNFYNKRNNLLQKNDDDTREAVRDGKLFEYAKEELGLLAAKNKPFVFTMMTMDTHFGTEYFDKEKCKAKYDEEFENVISCSDLQIYNFVRWLEKQDFYKNTTIVLLDDHLTMTETIFSNKLVDRKVFNVFINAFAEPKNEKNREFTALDIFPTLLESLGVKIKGSGLALGVSLFADKPTLVEQKMSVEKINEELAKKSNVYNQLLFGK